jgi:hypothetical protein
LGPVLNPGTKVASAVAGRVVKCPSQRGSEPKNRTLVTSIAPPTIAEAGSEESALFRCQLGFFAAVPPMTQEPWYFERTRSCAADEEERSG